MKDEFDVDVEWLPFELHPEIPPEGMELPYHIRAQFGGMSKRLEQLALDAGMQMTIPNRIPNSRRSLEASEYAREQGKHEAFHHTVFQKFYGEGLDMSDWEVLRSAAEEIGLDPDDLQQKTDSGQYKAVVDTYFSQAKAIGITGVPTYILDNNYAIVGAQPYEIFRQAMERLGYPSHPTK